MPCNVCNLEGEDERYGTIMRMEPDGTQLEIFAKGIRNNVGFAWNPKQANYGLLIMEETGLETNIPPDELNKAPEQGCILVFHLPWRRYP